jgi:hypothetical protein
MQGQTKFRNHKVHRLHLLQQLLLLSLHFNQHHKLVIELLASFNIAQMNVVVTFVFGYLKVMDVVNVSFKSFKFLSLV